MSDDKEHQTTKEWVNIVDPFAKTLIRSYLQRREQDLSLLRSSLNEKDFEYIRVKGHNLAGSGSAYGLDRVSEIGKLLEEAAQLLDATSTSAHIDELESYLNNLRIF